MLKYKTATGDFGFGGEVMNRVGFYRWDDWLKQLGGTTVLVVAQLLQWPKTNKF